MEERNVVYLDHAATSWPKPMPVVQAMTDALVDMTGNPGRGSHGMSLHAGRTLMRTRTKLAKLLGISNPSDIVFTSNATSALNLAIKGLLQQGDHVITTMLEHNSVRRPLEFLKRTKGVEVDYIPVDAAGGINLQLLEAAFRTNTRLVVCTHSSNLLGCIMPVEEIADIAHQHGAVLLVDGAQTTGIYPIHAERMGIDLLAFPGHKGLLGPQGTGGLYIHPDLDLEPVLHGGTGSQSDALEQPSVRPDRYEAGTANVPGIAGLGAGVDWVLKEGVENIYTREWQHTQWLMEELEHFSRIRLIGPAKGQPRTGIVSFVMEGQDPAETAFLLDRDYGIAVRAGYHCTPLGHCAAGTTNTGAVRVSVGHSTTEEELKTFIRAITEISHK